MALEFTLDPELTDELQAEVVACWTDVTNAGGSVGFVPPVATDDVLPTAMRALAAVAAGHDRLIIGRQQKNDETANREIDHSGTDPSNTHRSNTDRDGIASNECGAGGERGQEGAIGREARHDAGHEVDHAAGGRLAALAFLTGEQSQLTEHWRTVKRVIVHPDFQGRGYGSLLMAEIERVARAMGLHLLALDCRGGTGNDEFYKKCGYVEYGRLPGALKIGPDDYRDRVLMALSLRA